MATYTFIKTKTLTGKNKEGYTLTKTFDSTWNVDGNMEDGTLTFYYEGFRFATWEENVEKAGLFTPAAPTGNGDGNGLSKMLMYGGAAFIVIVVILLVISFAKK